jgi:hypothetical protein
VSTPDGLQQDSLQPDGLQQSEIAIIGRGVESVLRRLIRFLVGTISLTKLHELVNHIYVEELEEKLRRDEPGKAVTKSRMAMNTGLDTRVIARIQSSPGYKKSLVRESEFFRDFTPAAAFLHHWSTDPRFVDAETGMPRRLSVSGPGPSLEEMASTLKLPRGVTLKAVLRQLERSDLIDYDRGTETLTMRTDRYLPSPGKDREGALEIGFLAVCRLMDTVLGNLDEAVPEDQRLYQRVYWITRLPRQQRQAFRQKMVALLDEVEQQGYQQLKIMDQSFDTPSQLTAGFGLYLFEDPFEPMQDRAPQGRSGDSSK